jgi:hypothetical protein
MLMRPWILRDRSWNITSKQSRPNGLWVRTLADIRRAFVVIVTTYLWYIIELANTIPEQYQR